MLNISKKFIEFTNCKRIWAIGSIHGNLISLKNIHNHILEKFDINDKLIYLGNAIGVGEKSAEVISEIIKFRLFLMAKFQIGPDSIVFLRGAQEEMWLKLLELQISPNPNEVLSWMFNHGVDKTLLSYDLHADEILKICNLGTVVISKWTTKVRTKIEQFKGHREYYLNLNHAAFSETKKILFVNRGVDISRPLSAQNDCFWWGYHGLSKIQDPYYSFKRIVRGYDPKKLGPNTNNLVCSLYKGSGFGEYIVAGLFSEYGNIIDLFEA